MDPAPSSLRSSQDSATADAAHPEDVAAEERLLGAILVSHQVPIGVTADDFAVAENARIFEAAFALKAVGREVSVVNLWRHNKGIDPVNLSRIATAFAVDHDCRSWLGDVYAVEAATRARRRRGQETAV